nr:threonine--tRNA ligase [Candidatus Sigynarchaeota archaeon]
MRILAIHSNFLKVLPKEKAIDSAEPLTFEGEYNLKDCLVIFTSVESSDESDAKKAAQMFADEAAKIAEQINEKKIVIYPYAHLSSDLSGPKIAVEILKLAEKFTREKGYDVWRAPFGWYKAFEISCKGHPLSELSRSFTPLEEGEEKLKTREEIVEDITSEHFILTPKGEEIKINLEDEAGVIKILDKLKDNQLKAYMLCEELKKGTKGEPPSIDAMQHMELVDYAPEADLGHFKFFPKGKLIFDLICDWAHEIAVNRLGSYEIETPVIYDWGDPEIREQGGSFHERHYTVYGADDKKKKMVMRFAGDFGLFKVVKNVTMSYKQLPLRIYEFSKSFRYEQRGELTGLRRLRAFHMPDIHCFVANIDDGWKEYQTLYENYDDLAKGTGIEYAIVFRIVKEFYDKYKQNIVQMLKHSGRPAFIETLSKMKHYWAVKHEFQGIDSVAGNCQLSTVQLDVKDASTYGIQYVDDKGEKKGCIICHSSIGSIERWIYSILEDAFKKEVHAFPLWLSPTQVRIIPVKTESSAVMKKCEELSKLISAKEIRVDVDDTNETLSKRIRSAELEWVPYIVVIGERDLAAKEFQVRQRQEKTQVNMSPETLIKTIKDKTKGMPYRNLPVPSFVSKRVRFFG